MVFLRADPRLFADVLTVYHAVDPLFSNAPIVVLYGPALNSNGTVTGSYHQFHVFTPAGSQSFPRLAISPNSALYSSVICLSRDDQGDEVCRGLAFGLYKYLSELSDELKNCWVGRSLSAERPSSALNLFNDIHAANLASRMRKAGNSREIIGKINHAFAAQHLPSLDLDIVLPRGSIRDVEIRETLVELTDIENISLRYGPFAPLINLLGGPTFLPTPSIRRARSHANKVDHSNIFSKIQKEALRREMCELIDTEESYVSKLHDLVHNVAAEFREKAKSRSSSSSSPTESALFGLFPPSLDCILDINSGFLAAAQFVLEKTENDAIDDIAATNDGNDFTPYHLGSGEVDPTGVVDFSSCLLDWFPKFAECYGQYTQAHSDFSKHLRFFLNDVNSSFSQRVQETGEQRLMSMLIEPIQRLPRYSLYIDNIVKSLPARHSALKPLLRAKDMIADICSQDEYTLQQNKMLERLQALISHWPPEFEPKGRLINAADVIEMKPPYDPDGTYETIDQLVILLFAGVLVLVKRTDHNSLTAKGILSEVITPFNYKAEASNSHGIRSSQSLVFNGIIVLNDLHLAEMHNDRTLWLSFPNKISDTWTISAKKSRFLEELNTKCFLLKGTFQDKASQWIREVTKARLESRFSEEVRDGPKWEARNVEIGESGLEILTAVFEEGHNSIISPYTTPARTKLYIKLQGGSKLPDLRRDCMQIPGTISVLENGHFRLEIYNSKDDSTTDTVSSSELLPLFVKRSECQANKLSKPLISCLPVLVSPMLVKFHEQHSSFRYDCLLQHNLGLLKSLRILSEESSQSQAKLRNIRPPSPVKMLANLFNSTTLKENTEPKNLTFPTFDSRPSVIPPTKNRIQVKKPPPAASEIVTVETRSEDCPATTLQRLEDSFHAYILALHARKGNVVGRVVQSRAAASEAEVKGLYNAMLDTTSKNHQVAAQAPVDVLFAAFEEFIKVAWHEYMGSIIGLEDLRTMQVEYDGDIRATMANAAPQNRRALQGIIGLLGELLEGASNDGDRGILTAAFAEILISPYNVEHAGTADIAFRPHDFIPLLDRFVEDFHVLSDGDYEVESGTIGQDSFSTIQGTEKSIKPGSLSSKSSSLTRRLGFGSFKETNKSEFTPKVGQISRSPSRSGRLRESPLSLKSSHSADLDPSSDSPKRPASRDRSEVLSSLDVIRPQAGRNYDPHKPLPPVGDNSPTTPSSVRKRRRSSFSDLRSLPSVNDSPLWASPDFQRMDFSPSRLIPKLENTSLLQLPIKTNPQTEKLSHASVKPGLHNLKENAHPMRTVQLACPSVPASPKKFNPTNPSSSPSRGVLSERPASGNTPPPQPSVRFLTSDDLTYSKKLAMQSPHSLRERLQSQRRSTTEADAVLQAELKSIEEDLSAMASKPAINITSGIPVENRTEKLTLQNLNTRLKAHEAKVSHLISNLSKQNESINKDLLSSLGTSERKVKALEEKLELADAESVAIYERMNDELSKIFHSCRAGNAMEELVKKLRESQEESAKWKREVLRLKKDNLALKAQSDQCISP